MQTLTFQEDKMKNRKALIFVGLIIVVLILRFVPLPGTIEPGQRIITGLETNNSGKSWHLSENRTSIRTTPNSHIYDGGTINVERYGKCSTVRNLFSRFTIKGKAFDRLACIGGERNFDPEL
jgi:hypothetical protein